MQAGAKVWGLVLGDVPSEPPGPAVRRPSSPLLISAAQPGQAQTGMTTAWEQASRPQEATLRLPLGHHCGPCLTP